MNAGQIIEHLAADEIVLFTSEDGNLEIIGDQNAVDSWLETIRENKAAILAELKDRSIREESISETAKYIVLVTDASTDPVLVKVGITGLAIFDLEIPKVKYDGLAIIDAMNRIEAA